MREAGEGQAAGNGIAVASTVMDLAKAFETVSLVTAWRWCRHWGMNSAGLAVVFTDFAYAKRVCIDGCTSRAACTTTAIPVGSKWCCQILKAVLIWPMDQAPSLWPQVRARMWFDDLKLTAFGEAQSLAQSYPGAVASFIEGFEQAGLKVSRGEAGVPGGKTKTVASSKELEAGLRGP